MKPSNQLFSVVAFVHFVVTAVLSFFFQISTMAYFLGVEMSKSDLVIAWIISVLTFPVRNIFNLFSKYPDSWMSHFSGLFVILLASVVWSWFFCKGIPHLFRWYNKRFKSDAGRVQT